MDLHDDVKGIVGCCVQHLVESEPGIVHDMVDLAIFSITHRQSDLFSRYSKKKTGRQAYSRDSSVDNLLREIVGTDISSDREGVASRSLDLGLNRLKTFCVNTIRKA